APHEGPDPARVVARARPLDLDHPRAQLEELERAEGPRQHARQVDDDGAGEGPGAGSGRRRGGDGGSGRAHAGAEGIVPSPMPERIPIVVVSGFLGSGKTSLVRHLLEVAQQRGERLAVVSNELGALGIDRALLAGAAATEGAPIVRELEGGCVCCELTDDLVLALETLRREVAPDRIAIETSGVALPYDVQLTLWRPPVSEWIADDLGVVVVNAEQLAEGRELGDTFEHQVTAADLLVLNQIDRVPEAVLPELEARLHALEPEAPIVRALHG